MFPISYGWASIAFLVLSALYAYFTDTRCKARYVVSGSILVQIATTALAYRQEIPVLHLAAYASTITAFFAYLLWNETRYLMRKPYVALLIVVTCLTMLWGADSVYKTGLLYNMSEPSVYTLMCSVLTVLQGAILIISARGKHGRGRDRATVAIRIASFFDTSVRKGQ